MVKPTDGIFITLQVKNTVKQNKEVGLRIIQIIKFPFLNPKTT
jgi:hypothetical protein